MCLPSAIMCSTCAVFILDASVHVRSSRYTERFEYLLRLKCALYVELPSCAIHLYLPWFWLFPTAVAYFCRAVHIASANDAAVVATQLRCATK